MNGLPRTIVVSPGEFVRLVAYSAADALALALPHVAAPAFVPPRRRRPGKTDRYYEGRDPDRRRPDPRALLRSLRGRV